MFYSINYTNKDINKNNKQNKKSILNNSNNKFNNGSNKDNNSNNKFNNDSNNKSKKNLNLINTPKTYLNEKPKNNTKLYSRANEWRSNDWGSNIDEDSPNLGPNLDSVFKSNFNDNKFNSNDFKDLVHEDLVHKDLVHKDLVHEDLVHKDLVHEDLVPKYKVSKINFSQMELNALEEIRENIVDLAISENISSFNDKLILEDVNRFLINRFPNLDEYNRKILANNMFQELIGYGEIDSLIKDDDLEEIMVIGVNKPVFVYHRQYGMMETDLVFDDESKILRIIDSIASEANRRIDQQSPILDARMLDGSRVNATVPPLSADGPTLTIRKFKKDPLTIIDLIKSNTLNTEIAAFLWLTVDGLGVKPANIIISGGTSSGKTTLLNALSIFINPKERIITIEDTLELQFHHNHTVRMEARSVNIENQGEITIEDLVKNALRQRPDRIIVGEVRGSEAITLFTALNTGHSGFGTLHANNSRETISRLIHAPMSVPKIMISSIDYIIMEKRIYKSNGISFRRITEIDEVVGMEEGTISLNKLFKWDSEKDEFKNLTILSNTIEKLANLKGVSINDLTLEMENRKKVLQYLVDNDISSLEDIGSIMSKYYLDSKSLLNELNI